MRSLEQFIEYRVSIYILWICPILLFVIGTFRNILSIVVLMQRRNRSSSTARLLTALAVNDIVALVLLTVRNWPIAVFGVYIGEYSIFVCKFQTYLTYLASYCSVWFIVALTIQRFVVATFPLKAKKVCSLRNTNIVILCIVTVMAIFNIHIIVGIGITHDGKCLPVDEGYANFYYNILGAIQLAISFLLPLTFIFVGNVSIIINIVMRERVLGKNAIVPSGLNKGTSQITFTLLVLSSTFVVCITPLHLFLLFYAEEFLKGGNTHADAVVTLLWAISITLYNSNNAINSVLYILTGSKFRKEVKTILCKKKRKTCA